MRLGFFFAVRVHTRLRRIVETHGNGQVARCRPDCVFVVTLAPPSPASRLAGPDSAHLSLVSLNWPACLADSGKTRLSTAFSQSLVDTRSTVRMLTDVQLNVKRQEGEINGEGSTGSTEIRT